MPATQPASTAIPQVFHRDDYSAFLTDTVLSEVADQIGPLANHSAIMASVEGATRELVETEINAGDIVQPLAVPGGAEIWCRRLAGAWVAILRQFPPHVATLLCSPSGATSGSAVRRALIDCLTVEPAILEKIVTALFDGCDDAHCGFERLRVRLRSNLDGLAVVDGRLGALSGLGVRQGVPENFADESSRQADAGRLMALVAGTPLENLLRLEVVVPVVAPPLDGVVHVIAADTSARHGLYVTLAASTSACDAPSQSCGPVVTLDSDGGMIALCKEHRSKLGPDAGSALLDLGGRAPETVGLLNIFSICTDDSGAVGTPEMGRGGAFELARFVFEEMFGIDFVADHASDLWHITRALQAVPGSDFQRFYDLMHPERPGLDRLTEAQSSPSIRGFLMTRLRSEELNGALAHMRHCLDAILDNPNTRHLVVGGDGAAGLQRLLDSGRDIGFDPSRPELARIKPSVLGRLLLVQLANVAAARARNGGSGDGTAPRIIIDSAPVLFRRGEEGLEQILKAADGAGWSVTMGHGSLSEISSDMWNVIERYTPTHVVGVVGERDRVALAELLSLPLDDAIAAADSGRNHCFQLAGAGASDGQACITVPKFVSSLADWERYRSLPHAAA